MKILDYLKEIKITLAMTLSTFIILNLNLFLDSYLSKNIGSIIYINVLLIITVVIFMIIGYISRNRKLKKILYYINEERDDRSLNNDFYKVVDKKLSRYEEEIVGLKSELKEINDYMTNWIHQIKIPISVLEIISKRVGEIEEDNNFSKEINIEIKRIEALVEQALYSSRAGNYNSDFFIEEVNLERIVRDIIKKNKYLFIYNKIELDVSNLNYNVLTDKKWITHIIELILDNAVKYSSQNGRIEIFVTTDKKGTKLNIKDYGMGIVPQDIDRVFDKGFTGINGRKRTKSTGMGLYICKKILNKLSHDIDILSDEGEFCQVYITFYNLSDYFNVT